MNGAVVIRGNQLPVSLAVVPADAELRDGLVPTAGTWRRDGAFAHFAPRFAAPPGTVYAIVGRETAAEPWTHVAEVQVPRASVERSTAVQTIAPGVEQVPANLLRFSVTFSAPMSEGGAAAGIHLRDADGVDISGALLDMPPELWDRTQRRLTLLLEPGRIKRGLQPNVQAGPPLVEGSTVTLVIDPELQDARGQHLAAGAERLYRVGPPLRSRIDPARWRIQWPAAGDEQTESRLVVSFDRPLDRALLNRYLSVRDAAGHPVDGSVDINGRATVWSFTAGPGLGAPALHAEKNAPASIHWALQVDTRLEDLAGNSVRRVFDRDLSSPADDGITASHVVLRPNAGILLVP
ncbi:MAG: hypothetical protein JWQ19_547 [Subtercola sp.]|nr:hypothetical protein [Subtercola sp.]